LQSGRQSGKPSTQLVALTAEQHAFTISGKPTGMLSCRRDRWPT
jgi:hypothetical protein